MALVLLLAIPAVALTLLFILGDRPSDRPLLAERPVLRPHRLRDLLGQKPVVPRDGQAETPIPPPRAPGTAIAARLRGITPQFSASTLTEALRPNLRWDTLGLAVVTGFALVLRLLWLDRIPTNITADEADNLQVILRIQSIGEPGFFGFDWKPQPAFSMYLFLAFMRVFGDTPFGLRAASAILSSLALLPFYALARRVVSPAAALGGAVLLATGQWYLHFSRSGWENVHTAFYALLAGWALTVALERGRIVYFALAGFAAALGLYGYFAGRLILPALLAFAPLALLAAPMKRLRMAIGFLTLTGVACVLFLPQLVTIVERWEQFNTRTEAVNVLNRPRPYLGETSDLGILRVQLERTIAGFFLLDGRMFNNARYGPTGQPLYDTATGLAILGGLALSLRRWRQTSLWWCLMLVPLLGTQIFSAGTPDGARAILVAPFLYLFATVALDWLVRVLRPRIHLGAYGLLTLGVVGIAQLNVETYLAWIQTPVAAQARQPAVELGDYAAWQLAQLERIRANRFGFNVTQWHAMRASLTPGPLPAPQEARQPERVPAARVRFVGLVGEGRLVDPRGVAIAPDGSILVADAGLSALVRIAASEGSRVEVVGGTDLVEPVAVATRPDGETLVLDANRGEIVRFGLNGRVAARFGGNLGMYRPRGMAVAPDGDIYVADTGHQRVLVLSATGALKRTVGKDRLDQPTQVAVTEDGELLVAEPVRQRVQWLDSAERLVASWPISSRNTVRGPYLAAGANRLVLLSDPDAGVVRLATYDGKLVAEIGRGAAAAGGVSVPAGVALGSGPTAVIADRGHRAVLRFSVEASSTER